MARHTTISSVPHRITNCGLAQLTPLVGQTCKFTALFETTSSQSIDSSSLALDPQLCFRGEGGIYSEKGAHNISYECTIVG
jgi:hypothetical protein